MHYRRTDVAGATYFFTLNLAERHRTLLTDHIATLRTAMRGVKQRHPFHIDALVILPDHLHCIWTLPEGDADFPLRWTLIKAGFSRHISKTERRNSSRVDKGERGIWQRRYWEHMIRDERDYARHVDYIHYNPVKHGYAQRAADWPYSSIHRYIAAGMLIRDWGAGDVEEGGRFGER
jgi:putative transposase